MQTIIGTLASMLAYSNTVPKGTFILSMARAQQGYTKASLRIVGRENRNSSDNGQCSNVNLMETITEIARHVNGQAGGHHEAAGAFINTEKEKEFIEAAKAILSSKAIEEKILAPS